MAKATQTTKTKTKTVKITPKKTTSTAKNQKRCPTCGAFKK